MSFLIFGITKYTLFAQTEESVREIVNGKLQEGTHTYEFRKEKLPPGVYILKMQSGDNSSEKKILIK